MRPARPGIAQVAVFIIGALLFAFVCAKATISSFTHDESYTYLHYPHTGVLKILSFGDWFTNNHILNSLCMKISERLFGDSEVALRLPNLLLLVVYMGYGHRLFKKCHPIVTVALFILLSTNHLLMDLFGLARGYGLSCGFMLMSLYHLNAFLEGRKRIDQVLFHMAALLASLSSFALLTFYVAAMVACMLIEVAHARVSGASGHMSLRSLRRHLMPLAVSLVVLYEPVRRLVQHSDLSFGGKAGFYADTMAALIVNSFHGKQFSPWAMVVMQVLFTAVVLVPTFIMVRQFASKGKVFLDQHIGLVVSNLVTVIISIVIMLQHLLVGSDYPVARFSAFLFPLFVVHTGFLCQYVLSFGYQRALLGGVLGVALASMISFAMKAEPYASAEWRYDMHTKDMIRELTADHDENTSDKREVTLGINWLFEPTINFYRETRGLEWLMPVERTGPTGHEDYLYVFADELTDVDTARYEKVVSYEDIRTILLSRPNGMR